MGAARSRTIASSRRKLCDFFIGALALTAIVYLGIAGSAGTPAYSASSKALRSRGYRNIELFTGSRDECPETTMHITGFTAIAPDGRSVSGTVCSKPLWAPVVHTKD